MYQLGTNLTLLGDFLIAMGVALVILAIAVWATVKIFGTFMGDD
jgi:hypothetical protein